MRTRTLYSVEEYAKTKKTAMKYFRNRGIKGAQVLAVKPSVIGMRIQFIKRRNKRT